MTTFTATYSPDDNKLRLYASQRLDKETYERVRAAGFISTTERTTMRIETITRELFQFSELSDEAKEKARDWFRAGMAGDSIFGEHILEEFHDTLMPTLGFSLDKKRTYWSVGSYDDYATFDGSWYASEVKPEAIAALKADWPRDKEVHRLCDVFAELAALENARGSASNSYHGNLSCEFFAENAEPEHEEAFCDACRDLARWLKKTLVTEWEYQNSDECVDENIEANEYEFTADGKRA